MLERTLKFKFKERSYSISFPTNGQFIDIESKKVELTNGQLGNLISSRTIASLRTVKLVEIVSTFSILCPKLEEDLKVNSLLDLDVLDSIELIRFYNKNISPWLNSWFNEFSKIFEDELKKEEKPLEE